MASLTYNIHEILRVIPEETFAKILGVPLEVFRERLQSHDWVDWQESAIMRMAEYRGTDTVRSPGGPAITAWGELCARFGGPIGLANFLGVSSHSIRSWAKVIPRDRKQDVLRAIQASGNPCRYTLVPGAWGRGFGIIRVDSRGQDARKTD